MYRPDVTTYLKVEMALCVVGMGDSQIRVALIAGWALIGGWALNFRARTILAITARERDLQTQLQTQGRVSVGRVYPGDLAWEGSARGTILAISKRSSKRREGSAREGSILAISRGKGQRGGLSWRTPNAAPNAGKGQRGNGRAIEQSSHRDTCSG